MVTAKSIRDTVETSCRDTFLGIVREYLHLKCNMLSGGSLAKTRLEKCISRFIVCQTKQLEK